MPVARSSGQRQIAWPWISSPLPLAQKNRVQALMTLSFLVGMWADFLSAEARRMDKALALEICR